MITFRIIFAANCTLLLVFQWMNGMRRVHRQPELVLKAAHLVATADGLRDEALGGGKLGAQMLVRGDEEKNMPMGAKVTVTWPDGPDWFYGVQGQVVINRVQGKPYPYFYAVLVARQGHDLIESTDGMSLPSKVIRETQQKKGVDVVIVRQRTSKTSGYHTKVGTSRSILRAAIRSQASVQG